ncbi:hypothetical protein FJZ26_05565, partial [Candidatus Parvarchaeota archaeon]|nr:hypothetical protein [Candidatus Parvarchaeota archaeon]
MDDKLKQVPKKAPLKQADTFFEIKGVLKASFFNPKEIYDMVARYQPKGEKCVDDFLSWLEKNGKQLAVQFQNDLKNGRIIFEFPTGYADRKYDKSTIQKAIKQTKESSTLKYATLGVWLAQKYAANTNGVSLEHRSIPIYSRISLPDALDILSGQGTSFGGAFDSGKKQISLDFPLSYMKEPDNKGAIAMGFALGFHEAIHALATMRGEEGAYGELATFSEVSDKGLFLKESDVNSKNWFLTKRNSLVILEKIESGKMDVKKEQMLAEYMAYMFGPWLRTYWKKEEQPNGLDGIEPRKRGISIGVGDVIDMLQAEKEFITNKLDWLIKLWGADLAKENKNESIKVIEAFSNKRKAKFKALEVNWARAGTEEGVEELARQVCAAEGIKDKDATNKMVEVFKALWKEKVRTIDEFLKVFKAEMDRQFGKP